MAARSNADAYPKHFRDYVVPELRSVPGFAVAQLSRREIDDKVEFLVLTRWQSLDAIRGFTGADIEKAVVAPNAAAALIEFDATVRHYQVLEEISA
jgi:heme-degrading monooxygenase HmoA